MCTHPVLSGTAASVHVAPRSDEIITALSSSLPDHFSPGTVRHRNTGSSQSPLSSTTGGCRTNVPGVSISVPTGPHVRPLSSEMR
jgi:hypothetical protein